jgi:hypothetical protein
VATAHATESGHMKGANLVERGLTAVLSQTLRTIVHSRLEVGMAAYRTRYGRAEVLLLEPERDDYLMFFTNIFGLSDRRAVCEHAYSSTRRYLCAHHAELAPVFARHGVTLRREALLGERNLWQQVDLPRHLYAPPPARRRGRAGWRAGDLAAGQNGRRPLRAEAETSQLASVQDEPAASRKPATAAAAAVVGRLDEALRRLEQLVALAAEEAAPPA